MTDLELDVWDAWLRERQEHLEETLSNISPSEEPCRYYLLTGYIQGMLEALTMLTTVEDGKRFKIKLEQFRQNLLLSGDYDATGNYKQAVKKTAVYRDRLIVNEKKQLTQFYEQLTQSILDRKSVV